MAIKGLTDTLQPRRDGKIRAGMKDDRDIPKNLDHFLLHDAPQLIPILGDKPTDIYFTVYEDHLDSAAQNYLAWYSKSELMCRGDGEVAAYFGTGDASGVKQKQAVMQQKQYDGRVVSYPIPRARERVCLYRGCPDYQTGKCTEHLVLKMILPHYSMASMFELENTSINGLLNVISAFRKAQILTRGKLKGHIYRLYKQPSSVNFMNPKTGKRERKDTFVINMEYVKLEDYMDKFKDRLTKENLDALLALRDGSLEVVEQANALSDMSESGPQSVLPGSPNALHLPSPEEMASEEELVKQKASAPAAAPLFEELANLVGVANSEMNRLKTARNFADVNSMVDYLKKRVDKLKKEGKKLSPGATASVVVENPAEGATPGSQQDTAPVELPLGDEGPTEPPKQATSRDKPSAGDQLF